MLKLKSNYLLMGEAALLPCEFFGLRQPDQESTGSMVGLTVTSKGANREKPAAASASVLW